MELNQPHIAEHSLAARQVCISQVTQVWKSLLFALAIVAGVGSLSQVIAATPILVSPETAATAEHPHDLTSLEVTSATLDQDAAELAATQSNEVSTAITEIKTAEESSIAVRTGASLAASAPRSVETETAATGGVTSVRLEIEPVSPLLLAEAKADGFSTPDTATTEISATPAESLPGISVAQIAQTTGSLKEKYLIPVPPLNLFQSSRLGLTRVITGMTISTPVAFGAQWRDVFGVAGLQSRTRIDDEVDGGIGFGAGFGDPFRYVGLEVVVNSFSNVNNAPFSSGGFSFKVHRRLPQLVAIAVGVENAINFGNTDSVRSVYGVVSKIFPLRDNPIKPFSFLTVSLGAGTGRFGVADSLVFDNGNTTVPGVNTDSVNVFASAALQMTQQIAFISNWNGQDLDLGFAIAPIRNVPFIITPAVADVTGNSGSPPRFLLTIGYGFRF